MALKGHRVPVPQWAAIMSIANGDPLRAQEIEEKLSERWWNYSQEWESITNSIRKESDRGR